jgi:hypothetical protein
MVATTNAILILLLVIKKLKKFDSCPLIYTGSIPSKTFAHDIKPSINLNIDLDIEYKNSQNQSNIISISRSIKRVSKEL